MHGHVHSYAYTHPSLPAGGYSFDPGQPAYMHGRIDKSASRVTSFYPTTATDQPKSWSHDMIITENYIINVESSIQFDGAGLLEGKPFAFNYEHKFRLGVASKTSKDHSEVRWFEFDRPYGLVHHLSAWEETRNGVDYVVIWTPLGE